MSSLRAGDTRHGLDLEVDAWGVSRNGAGAAYLVKIKSKFRDRHIKQVWQLVERFRIHKSEYRERAVYPIPAVVDISVEGRTTVWNPGVHSVEIDDGVFQYAKPPKDFEANGDHGMHGGKGTCRICGQSLATLRNDAAPGDAMLPGDQALRALYGLKS